MAIALSLEQTKYFTQGCPNLIVKQRTLSWSFEIVHVPGKDNKFPDAASRFPSSWDDDNEEMHLSSLSMTLSSIRVHENNSADDVELSISTLSSATNIRAVTLELIKEETGKVASMLSLIALVNATFPTDKLDLPSDLVSYWPIRDSLYVVDGG